MTASDEDRRAYEPAPRTAVRSPAGSFRWWLRTLLLGVLLGILLWVGRLALGMLP
jgi:hypothetical protein